MTATYGYVRVSSTDQNIDRQITEMRAFGIPDRCIFVDKKSGSDFDRPAYRKLIRKLRKDDLLVVKSIDRLGRNYIAITAEWQLITKQIECDILVLDMPLLDTRIRADNLMGRFISDIVLQILSFVAENERENIKRRQAEGIRSAKKRGVRFGRPSVVPNPCFDEICLLYLLRLLPLKRVLRMLRMKQSTFYKYYQFFRERFYARLDERNTDFDAWRADTDLKLLERELKGRIRDPLRP